MKKLSVKKLAVIYRSLYRLGYDYPDNKAHKEIMSALESVAKAILIVRVN